MTTSLILLVDDEPLLRLYLRRVLARACPTAAVLLAGSVNEAQHIFEANEITAIVSDYHLGDGTAMDILQIVQAAAPDCPVVVTSTDTTIEAAVLAAGAAQFVSKLAPVSQLEQALAILC